MARVRRERDGDLTAGRRTRPLGAEVVLDVARAPLVRGDDRVDRPLTLELANDRVVAEPECVREDVQSSAVRHADHDLVRAVLGGELDRLVEHRHHHVQALDRELLLAEEGAAQVLLERLDTGKRGEQLLELVRGELVAVLAGLDRLPQPHALLVVGDVLDLVRDRPAVRVVQPWQRVGERLAGDIQT